MWPEVHQWFVSHAEQLVRVGVIMVVGFGLTQLLGRSLRRALLRRFTQQAAVLLSNGIRHTLNVLIVLSVLRQFDFRLDALLAAAGVLGVAVGFASQTGLSNLISGAFLLWESPFRIGDAVEIDATSGVVYNIDMLATYVRTFDNRLVRLPNELVLKTRVVNITRFPVRRLDLPIGVSYREDVERVMRVLAEVADANPLCLDEPVPLVMFTGFGASSLDFMLAVWCEKADFIPVRSALLRDIKERFDREGIVIPYPQMVLHRPREKQMGRDASDPAP